MADTINAVCECKENSEDDKAVDIRQGWILVLRR